MSRDGMWGPTSCLWVLFGLFFMFSNLYQLDLLNKTRVALAKESSTKAGLKIGPLLI